MKNFYMSITDYSEIRFLTGDITDREDPDTMLAEKGIKVTDVELRMLLESALSEFNKVFENSGTQGNAEDWVANNEGSSEGNAE